MTMKRVHRALLESAVLSLSIAMLASCGGSESAPAPPPRPAERAPTPPHPKKQRLSISGQLGSLDERKVEETFSRLLPKFGDCVSQGSSRVEFIGGHVKVFVRIGIDGSAKWAFLPESTIGDRESELCILNIAKAARWPVPAEG